MSLPISKDQFILSNYRIGKTLGEGTFGKVKLGIHIPTEEKVAVKILQKQKIIEQSDIERVTRQICILKTLRHPNIIQLYQIIQTKKDIYLIMEYADGGELFEYIVKKKRVQQKQSVAIMQQILSGVEYIHKNGIVHRDLKPQNLLFDNNKNIKIVDFGLSNQYKQGQKLKTACGSPCYAAPQMIAGKSYQCLNIDIWSCGVILYALLCGYLPFQDPNTNKLYKKILSGQFDIPKFISPDARDLMKKMLNVDPEARYKINQIRESKWYNIVKQKFEMNRGIIVGQDTITIDQKILNQLENYQVDSKQARIYLLNNKHNQITALYYLLVQKYKREGFPKRSQSPIIYNPHQKIIQKGKNVSLTDRDQIIQKRKKIDDIQSIKNDNSMNASNIISSLIEANKNNNKFILNLKNKKRSALGVEGELINFDKVENNKIFPQKEAAYAKQLSDRNESVRLSTDNVFDNNRNPRMSLNQPTIKLKNLIKKTDESTSYSRKSELSEQLNKITEKIDKQLIELKKQNESYLQNCGRRDSNISSVLSPKNIQRKKNSQETILNTKNNLKNRDNDKLKLNRMNQNMNTHNGPFNPRSVFMLSPRILYQKILAFLQSNNIKYVEMQKNVISLQKGINISVQLLQNMQNIYVVCFSQKCNFNQKLLNFLEC